MGFRRWGELMNWADSESWSVGGVTTMAAGEPLTPHLATDDIPRMWHPAVKAGRTFLAVGNPSC